MMQFFHIQWAWIFMILPLFFACSKPIKTVENLKSAISSERNTSVRYTAFAIRAREEGYRNICNLFRAMSRAETIQAENKGDVLKHYEWGYRPDPEPVGLGYTLENLKSSLLAEKYECYTVFPIFTSLATGEEMKTAEQIFGWAALIAERHVRFCNYAICRLEKDESDRQVADSWSVCPRCGCPYPTVKVEEVCKLCYTPSGLFLLFQ